MNEWKNEMKKSKIKNFLFANLWKGQRINGHRIRVQSTLTWHANRSRKDRYFRNICVELWGSSADCIICADQKPDRVRLGHHPQNSVGLQSADRHLIGNLVPIAGHDPTMTVVGYHPTTWWITESIMLDVWKTMMKLLILRIYWWNAYEYDDK